MKLFKQISYFCFLMAILIACHKNIENEFTTVTSEELYSLFNFDIQKDVYENLQLLHSFNKEKQYHVNGKIIVISKYTADNVDASQGEFNLSINGTVNHIPFQQTLKLNGFKIKIPEETNNNENKKNEKNEDVQEDIIISTEELKSLFSFDTSQTMQVLLTDLEKFKGEKHINGKLITINEVSVKQQDIKSGTFTLLVTGKINSKMEFRQTLNFTGVIFEEKEKPVNKPTDYNMAQRANIQITNGKNIYESNFDTFYRENKVDEFALQLKDFITVSSSNNDGQPYIYTQEDMQNTSFSDMRYEAGEKKLYLKVTYKGNTSPELFIYFDKNEYYQPFVTVNKAETGKYYQSGILHYTEEIGNGGYLFNQFVKARKDFKAEYQSHQNAGEYIYYSIKLLSPSYKELAQFDVAVNGFKELVNLKNELIITGGRYSDYIRTNLNKNTNIEGLIKNSFYKNIENLLFSINGTTPLFYSSEDHLLFNEDDKCLYFKDVIIEYHSIEKDRKGDITLKVKLSSINGTILDEIIPINHFLLSSDLK